jgi:cardiolipin synthase
MLEAIAGAERSLEIEVYIFAADHSGRAFAETLGERARAGVRVRVLADAVGSMGSEEAIFARLRAAGVEVRLFRPLSPWRSRFGIWPRDHRKLLLVDDRIGLTGGCNIGDDYAPPRAGAVGWKDVSLEVEGPAVWDLRQLFEESWFLAGGERRPMGERPLPLADGDPVQIVGNRGRERWDIRRSYLRALGHARRFVYLANAYFVPDGVILRALRGARRRGVEVQLLVPGRSDIGAVAAATRALYGRLLRWGVRIFEWSGPMMHAKTAVIDGEWSTVGSSNLDSWSLRYNLEINANVLGQRFGEAMVESFGRDLEQAVEVSLVQWRTRPLWRRIVEWLAYRVRRFL